MSKLAKYVVRGNKIHGGHIKSQHVSILAAIRSIKKHTCKICRCDGPSLEGINGENYDGILLAYSYYRYYQRELQKEAIELAMAHPITND